MKYEAIVSFTATKMTSVEANSAAEAIEAAFNSDAAHCSLCCHCARELEIGCADGVIVTDESGLSVTYPED